MHDSLNPSHGRVCTLGMFIIDKFQSSDGSGTVEPNEQIGGGGVYAMIGARIFLPASAVGIIVDRGIDFPSEIQSRLEEYGLDMLHFRDRTDGECLTTRALGLYSSDGHQSFSYLTPTRQIFPSDITASPFFRPVPPAFLHLVCSPARLLLIQDELDEIARNGVGEDGFGKGWDPQLVWEPTPWDCIPKELQNIIARTTTSQIKVLSPNHIEALSLFGVKPSRDPRILAQQILKATYELERDLPTGKAVIVRAGVMGAFVCTRDSHGKMTSRIIPAYYGKEQQASVIDCTGGGNAFLGGVCAGLLLSDGNVFQASLYGMVSASFAIEQGGLPRLTQVDGRELWNGQDPFERLNDITRWIEEE